MQWQNSGDDLSSYYLPIRTKQRRGEMDNIEISGETYRWFYEERDGSHWYIPSNAREGHRVKGYRFTLEELKENFGVQPKIVISR